MSLVTRNCILKAEGGEECEPGKCLSQRRCPEKVRAMKRMQALLAASRRVRDGRWIRGAPTHVLADFMGELEKAGWTLVHNEEGVK